MYECPKFQSILLSSVHTFYIPFCGAYFFFMFLTSPLYDPFDPHPFSLRCAYIQFYNPLSTFPLFTCFFSLNQFKFCCTCNKFMQDYFSNLSFTHIFTSSFLLGLPSKKQPFYTSFSSSHGYPLSLETNLNEELDSEAALATLGSSRKKTRLIPFICTASGNVISSPVFFSFMWVGT